MRKFFKEHILPILSTITLSIILPMNNWDKAQIIAIVLISYLLLWGFSKYLIPIIKAYYQTFTISKVRGLWGGKDLDSIIKNLYSNSSEVKIKVTRGTGLFSYGKIFHECLHKKKYDDKKIVKVLLHYPCLRSAHIIDRAKANGIKKEKYVEDLFETLKMFKQHSRQEQNEKIFVKFYTPKKEKEWRFYIFDTHKKSKVLLFNHYNDKIQGSKSKMLKIKSGNNSLCDDMNKTFDNLYENGSLELISNTIEKEDLINSDYCGHSECRTLINKIYKDYF